MSRILIIEDDTDINNMMAEALRKAGYECTQAFSGTEGLLYIERDAFDLAVLDLMLPGMNGEALLPQIKAGQNVPVIVVSAKDSIDSKVGLLTSGAEDYLTKPFYLDELATRNGSLTLRRFTKNDVVLSCGNLLFDTKLRKASVSGDNLTLTRKETEILEYLILNQGRPISQEEFLEHVWDSSIDDFSNSIRVHISSLRKKLRAALGYDPIHNRIGEGYVMENKK